MRRAGPWAIGALALTVLAGGLGVVALRGADSSRDFGEQAALDAFRSASPVPPSSVPAAPSASSAPGTGRLPDAAQPSPTGPPAAAGPTAAPPAAAAPQPAPAPADARDDEVPAGVYRYDTEGFEEVDALGGARHDYPATSTVTYSRRGCGTEQRWQPLEERVGVTLQCAGPDGDEIRSTYQEREFFGQRQSESYACSPGTLAVPRDPRPGQTWQGRCSSDDSTVDLAGSVVALEELVVDGTPVPVVRIRVTGTLTGSTRGRSDREAWLARRDGLLVQMVASTDTLADSPGGEIRYRESYRLRLQSLTPRR